MSKWDPSPREKILNRVWIPGWDLVAFAIWDTLEENIHFGEFGDLETSVAMYEPVRNLHVF